MGLGSSLGYHASGDVLGGVLMLLLAAVTAVVMLHVVMYTFGGFLMLLEKLNISPLYLLAVSGFILWQALS